MDEDNWHKGIVEDDPTNIEQMFNKSSPNKSQQQFFDEKRNKDQPKLLNLGANLLEKLLETI